MRNEQATAFMEHEPVAATPGMELTDLVELFWRERVRALPVTEAGGRLVGVVSETDLFLKNKGVPFSLEKVPALLGEAVAKDELAELEVSAGITVADVMTAHPVTITADTTVADAAMAMLDRGLSVLPVVDGDRLVGMVRRIQLLRRIYDRDH